MSKYPRSAITRQPQPLVEVAPVPQLKSPSDGIPSEFRDRVFIDVIHDGHWIPDEFLIDRHGNPITFDQFDADFVRERDWGACLIAERLATQLGLSHYVRINVARVLMDFGRFPGSTPPHAEHLSRFAINYPFSELLSYAQKKHLLENYYDKVSEQLEPLIAGKLVKIAIHTYDQHNPSGTERPATSLMTRSIGYQTSSELPWGLFDPLYPDILAEFTSDRILRDRISLTLEKSLIPVAHNYPYCLPEGSLEVRYQVWAYFNAVRQAFEQSFPESINDPSFAMVWEMLTDTNLRSSSSEVLRSYLHMYRRAPEGRHEEFLRASSAYAKVETFCNTERARLLDAYRFSPQRTSSIAIEVRKDIICDLAPDGRPRAVRTEQINKIADQIAAAVAVYFREDRAPEIAIDPNLDRHDPWYLAPRQSKPKDN